MTESGTDSPIEQHLLHEDAVSSSNPSLIPRQKRGKKTRSLLLVLLFSSLSLSEIDDYGNCRSVAFAFVITMMELSFGNFPVVIIFIPPV